VNECIHAQLLFIIVKCYIFNKDHDNFLMHPAFEPVYKFHRAGLSSLDPKIFVSTPNSGNPPFRLQTLALSRSVSSDAGDREADGAVHLLPRNSSHARPPPAPLDHGLPPHLGERGRAKLSPLNIDDERRRCTPPTHDPEQLPRLVNRRHSSDP
jgi:hypothetical protein